MPFTIQKWEENFDNEATKDHFSFLKLRIFLFWVRKGLLSH